MTAADRKRRADDRTADLVLDVLWRIRAHVKGDTPLPDGRSDGDPS